MKFKTISMDRHRNSVAGAVRYRPVRRQAQATASEPRSIHEELSDMRRQIEARLRQPQLL